MTAALKPNKHADWFLPKRRLSFKNAVYTKGLILIYQQGNFHLYQYKTDPNEAFGLQNILGLFGERQLCENKENNRSS